MVQIQCTVCGKVVQARSANQQTCLSLACKRVHRQRLQSRQQDKVSVASKSGLCAVCRGPLPKNAAPNTRVCSKECKHIANQYEIDLHVYVMPDSEYKALGLEPPEPGFTLCLGHGYPKHQFWSPDKKKVRVCQTCKEKAANGSIIHSMGSVVLLTQDFAYLDGIAISLQTHG